MWLQNRRVPVTSGLGSPTMKVVPLSKENEEPEKSRSGAIHWKFNLGNFQAQIRLSNRGGSMKFWKSSGQGEQKTIVCVSDIKVLKTS